VCNAAGHSIVNCQKFRQMSNDQKFRQVKELHHCINCLIPGHTAQYCRSRPCKICHLKHHILLHNSRSTPQQSQQKDHRKGQYAGPTKGQLGMDSNLTSAVSNTTRNHVFLATAVIRVLNKDGESIECRALLDPGSQVNLMTDKLCKQLHLQCNDVILSIKGTLQIQYTVMIVEDLSFDYHSKVRLTIWEILRK